MSEMIAACEIASGVSLLSSLDCFAKRCCGTALLAAGLVAAGPALGDETVIAADNGSVQCDASKQDLTRISLRDDRFAAVSKVASAVVAEDFSVVHEPTRGDIYISVPDGYQRNSISFFGTTQKGFVYKFICRVGGADATQVFVANADSARAEPAAVRAPHRRDIPLGAQAVALIKAMFEQRPIEGFEIRDEPRVPVTVGSLKVQLVSEYDGLTMAGKILRIENTGEAPVAVSDELIAPSGAIAVSIVNARLEPRRATGAYVVVPAGDL
ncbi:type-F conjugative transfer system secretin TraK [Sphingobium sp.]|uniref:type-F conjugative transfer system secretin TraK n=1 Tax=Sphingobium sp. TaxID=1912891 RepID=UPI002CFFD0DA|nr:type-F conjugative transfer system secretin TraK [Sphingobium sp.]HUD94863.1 type-F conjugative transfer system secretin TraK [Sphingobium sp.]